MGNLLWAIIKDGLKGFAFWAVASVIMILLWGYTGRMLALGLGLIFIVAFIGGNLKRVLHYFTGGAMPFGGGSLPGVPAGQQPVDGRIRCSTCGGSGRMICSGCGGRGGHNLMPQTESGGMQWVPHSYCVGSGSVQCTSCSGTGYLNA
jgi:hypothetical protein